MGSRFCSLRWLRAFISSAALLTLPSSVAAHTPGEPLGATAYLGAGWLATNYGLLQDAGSQGWLWAPEEILDRQIYVWSLEPGGERVWVGAEDGLWRTKDGGCSWERAGLDGVGVRALVWRDGTLYAGGESASGAGGIFTLASGQTASTPAGLNDGAQISGIAVGDDGRVRACGHDPAAGRFRLWEDNIPIASDARRLLGSTRDALLLLDTEQGLLRFDGAGISPSAPPDTDAEPVQATLDDGGRWVVLLGDGSVRRGSDAGWESLELPVTRSLGRPDAGQLFFGFDTTSAPVHLRLGDIDVAPFEAVRPRVCNDASGKAAIATLWPVIGNLGVGPTSTTEPENRDEGCQATRTPAALVGVVAAVMLLVVRRRRRELSG